MPPAIFGKKHLPLPCDNCGRDVLALDAANQTLANVAMLIGTDGKIGRVYVACIPDCDRELKARTTAGTRILNSWTHLDEWLAPSYYLRLWSALANDAQRFSPPALEKVRDILLLLAPFIMNGEPVPLRELQEANFKPGL